MKLFWLKLVKEQGVHLISLKNILKYLLRASSAPDTVSDSGETQMSSVDIGSVL